VPGALFPASGRVSYRRRTRKSSPRHRSFLLTAVIRPNPRLAIYSATIAVVAVTAFVGLELSGQTGCRNPLESRPCTRVLFVGNSYTTVNDLPVMFAKLSRSGGHRVETGIAAVDGWSLADHAGSSATARALTLARWNTVVLQEQSQIPSVSRLRQDQMYPAARKLIAMVRTAGAEPLLFLTWARRDGWRENGLVDYTSMQSAIDDGYLGLAAEQLAGVAPVGYAWQTLLAQEATPGLWQSDGSHPTAKGTYLAACVFYAAIFHQSPQGLTYHGGLNGDEASRLQQIAATTVLSDPARWGLL
jgi:hypothetical protein